MFWNKSSEIIGRLEFIENSIRNIRVITNDEIENITEDISDIRDRINELEKALVNPAHSVDKYATLIRHIEVLLKEFMGSVSIARAAIAERKEADKQFDDLKVCAAQMKTVYAAILNQQEYSEKLNEQHFKISAMYEILVKDIPKRKRKTIPKKGASP